MPGSEVAGQADGRGVPAVAAPALHRWQPLPQDGMGPQSTVLQQRQPDRRIPGCLGLRKGGTPGPQAVRSVPQQSVGSLPGHRESLLRRLAQRHEPPRAVKILARGGPVLGPKVGQYAQHTHCCRLRTFPLYPVCPCPRRGDSGVPERSISASTPWHTYSVNTLQNASDAWGNFRALA